MKEKQSVLRERFENDTFPYLDALGRTSLWLTMSGSLAENLVLKTMTRAYLEWQHSDDSISSKARLFRILTREFFGFGNGKQQRLHQATPFHSEDIRITASPEERNPRSTTTAIRPSQLPLLARVSDVAVKGAIARFRPHSRLMLILLYRERFSYTDIVYITDLSEKSVKAMLTRLRRLFPGYILETADCLKEISDSQLVVGKNDGEFDRDRENISLRLPSICARECPTNAAARETGTYKQSRC